MLFFYIKSDSTLSREFKDVTSLYAKVKILISSDYKYKKKKNNLVTFFIRAVSISHPLAIILYICNTQIYMSVSHVYKTMRG